jgi:hypothetical protein
MHVQFNSSCSQYTSIFYPAYSQYTSIFTPHILSVCTISFCIFSVYIIFYPAYSQYTSIFILHILSIHHFLSCIFSVYINFHLAYSQCMYNFIPHILCYASNLLCIWQRCKRIQEITMKLFTSAALYIKGDHLKIWSLSQLLDSNQPRIQSFLPLFIQKMFSTYSVYIYNEPEIKSAKSISY